MTDAALPQYSTNLAANQANQATRLSDLATMGQHVNGVIKGTPGTGKWVHANGSVSANQNPTPQQAAEFGLHQEGGTPGTPDQLSVENANPQGKSVLDILGGPALTPNTALDPNNNPYLPRAAGANGLLASGEAGQRLGGTQSALSLGSAGQVIGQIGSAGQTDAARQQAQITQGQGLVNQGNADLGVIRNTANGVGPSPAQDLARAQMDNAIRAQAAQAATARGGNIAAGMRSAANAGTQISLQSMPQLAAARSQEQLQAQSLLTQGNAAVGQTQNNLAGTVATARGQDVGQAVSAGQGALGVANGNTTLYGVNSGNAQAGATGLGNNAGTYAQGAGVQAQSDANARQAYADWLQRQYSIASGVPVSMAGTQGQIAIANQQADIQRTGAIIGAAGAGAAAVASGFGS